VSTVHAWLARARAIFGRNHANRLKEEMELHAELLAAEHRHQGMPEKEAHYAARRDLGNVTRLEEEYRQQNGLPVLENLWRDLRFAVRMLRRNPVYAVSCIATLAVGLGSMITVLSVVSALLWKPLPYPRPERLVVLHETDPRGGLWPFSEPDWLDVQQRSQSLEAVAAYRPGQSALTGLGEPETIQSAAVTPSTFAMFGIKPLAGRVFGDSPDYVVISRNLWQRRWHANRAVVGQAVVLDGQHYTIAGVANLPEDLLPGVQVLVPLLPKAAESRTLHEIQSVGRLLDHVGERQAQAELNAVGASIAHENPATNARWGLEVTPLSGYLLGPHTGRRVWMIFAAVALFWMLACANVAGLQLARSISRRHEMSTRLALGASKRRLFAQTLTECAVLAIGGSLFGLLIAGYAMDAIRSLAGDSLPRLAHLQFDGMTIGIALGCMLFSTLLFSLLANRQPEFQGGRELSRRDRGRDALIAMQVALASILVLGASLLLHSFLRLQSVNPGFDPDKILTVRVNLSTSALDSSHRVAIFDAAAQRLSRLPEVEAAGATNVPPFSGWGTANRFRLDGESASAAYRSAAWRAVTPGFFTTLGLPLKRGRLFNQSDRDGSLEVVILSESMAKKFWPNQDPIGKRLLWGRSQNPKTVVGIVGDLRDLAVDTSAAPTMFRPFAQLSDAPMTLVIRTRRDPATAIADVRRAIWSIDRNAALEFESLRQAMADSIQRPRVSFLAFAAFAVIAMITAAFGLYGLISYRVNQRQQEIGIRLALGCPAGSVRWGVQKRCLVLVCAGLAIGLPVAYALSTLIASLLYETRPAQASVYAVVLLVFAAVALVASYGPARRAARMDPAAAIHYE
jgi:predicted permease